jgi:hypothetical protein
LSCQRPRPSRTSRPCCLGVSYLPIADQQPEPGTRVRSIDRLHHNRSSKPVKITVRTSVSR